MPSDSLPNMLYVVLNGLISLVDTGPNFDAYLLEMGDEHRYLYGNFLSEDEIPTRVACQPPLKPLLRAELLGVDDGSEHLNTGSNAIVQIDSKNFNPQIDLVRAVFTLPRPARILHFLMGALETQPFTGNDTSSFVRPPINLSAIRVFEYTFANQEQVILKNHSPNGDRILWTCPAPTVLNDRKLAVLHFYDCPGSMLADPVKHTTDEFKKSADFLGIDLQLAKTTTSASITTPELPLLPGLLAGELKCLPEREESVLQLLEAVRLKDLSKLEIGHGITGCPNEVCAGCNAVLTGGH